MNSWHCMGWNVNEYCIIVTCPHQRASDFHKFSLSFVYAYYVALLTSGYVANNRHLIWQTQTLFRCTTLRKCLFSIHFLICEHAPLIIHSATSFIRYHRVTAPPKTTKSIIWSSPARTCNQNWNIRLHTNPCAVSYSSVNSFLHVYKGPRWPKSCLWNYQLFPRINMKNLIFSTTKHFWTISYVAELEQIPQISPNISSLLHTKSRLCIFTLEITNKWKLTISQGQTIHLGALI
jgi:hypothetical protein